jgi:xanthine dehydrogenase YagR molybdenum-binding subunit
LGEPPIIPTAAAVANAIANATGARVRHAPMTRARVLEALALVEAQ